MKHLLVYGMLLIAFGAGPSFGHGTQSVSREAGSTNVGGDYGVDLGTVYFPVSCNQAASGHAERGLALLHHMTYEGAREAFAAATEADPDCAMGYWGQAMSFIHPLWSDPPNEAEFDKGRALLDEAKSRGEKTARERAYLAAVESYYAPGWNRDEKPNLAGFEQGWRKVHDQFPEDPEAATFYALAHMATADPEDKSYAKQKRAAAIARRVLERIPDHPGAHHYTIHAYDYPELAEKAPEVARSYGEIAPAVPHAMHMPSHIFTRLGMWQESIELNQRSADAALEHPAGEKISMHYLHAIDYLAYAYLQQAADQQAEEVLETIENLEGPFQAHVASAYTFAAVPARISLERKRWSEAARIEPREPRNYPWDEFPAMEAITYFARALGAARSGHAEAAHQALDKLAALRDQAATTSDYWANQVEIQRLAAKAWLAFHQGRSQQALRSMQEAAEMESATEKHPVTPGEVLPAREMLADMLFEMGRYQDAQKEYKAALERSPNRFNSMYGIARAAELAGNNSKAARYFRKLVEQTTPDTERERLQQAKAFLAATNE